MTSLKIGICRRLQWTTTSLWISFNWTKSSSYVILPKTKLPELKGSSIQSGSENGLLVQTLASSGLAASTMALSNHLQLANGKIVQKPICQSPSISILIGKQIYWVHLAQDGLLSRISTQDNAFMTHLLLVMSRSNNWPSALFSLKPPTWRVVSSRLQRPSRTMRSGVTCRLLQRDCSHKMRMWSKLCSE